MFVKINEDLDQPILVNSLDDDQLSYQFSPIYKGGGTNGLNGVGDPQDCDGLSPEGPCYPPYEFVDFLNSDVAFYKPFPGWESQGLDGQSGSLLGTPTEMGQFAYGLTIHEFRDGLIINSTNFDYLVNAVSYTHLTLPTTPYV